MVAGGKVYVRLCMYVHRFSLVGVTENYEEESFFLGEFSHSFPASVLDPFPWIYLSLTRGMMSFRELARCKKSVFFLCLSPVNILGCSSDVNSVR